MLSVSFESYDSTFCMVIVSFYMPFLSCSFSIHFSISYIVLMRSMVFISSDFKRFFIAYSFHNVDLDLV